MLGFNNDNDEMLIKCEPLIYTRVQCTVQENKKMASSFSLVPGNVKHTHQIFMLSFFLTILVGWLCD